MSNGDNIVLYGSGLFSSNDSSTNQEQLDELQDSGFTTVILWTLHVQSNGDFSYNDNPIVSSGTFNPDYDYMADLITELKSGGTVEKVLFCIGSSDVSDYADLKNLLATESGTETVESNFQALIDGLPIDGFDFDLEEFPLEDYTGTIVQLTLMLHQDFDMAVTYCPYTDEDFWLTCLNQVSTQNNGQQIVSWLNLQCYSGGAGNDPGYWAEQIESYPSSELGIDDPAAFVVPGYACRNGDDCSQGDCPSTIQQTFASLTQSDAGINGGFIWKSSNIFSCEDSGQCGGGSMTPEAYAQAIIDGLSGDWSTR